MFIGMVDVALAFGFSIISLLVYSEQLCCSRLCKSVQVHGARVQAAEWELLDWCTSGQAKQAGNVFDYNIQKCDPEWELVRMIWIGKKNRGKFELRPWFSRPPSDKLFQKEVQMFCREHHKVTPTRPPTLMSTPEHTVAFAQFPH